MQRRMSFDLEAQTHEIAKNEKNLNLNEEIAQASKFEQILNQLEEFGFSKENAICGALVGKDLELAIEFLVGNRQVDKHSFVPGNSMDLCVICGESEENHTKIEFKSEENKEFEKVKINLEKMNLDLDVPKVTGDGTLCGICFCEFVNEDELQILGCQHFFCKNCITEWIKVQISDGKVLEHQIFCPNVECRKPIEMPIIEKLSDATTLQKFQKFSRNIEIEKDKSKMWCPKLECDGVIERKSKFFKKGICSKCQYEACFRCKKEFHGYFKSCGSVEDEAFNSWAKDQFMKRCPSCSKFIIKLDGCNHMTCSCGYQFCWICGGKYNSSHFKSWNILGCPGMQFSKTQGLCTNNIFARILFRLVLMLFISSGVLIAGGLFISVYLAGIGTATWYFAGSYWIREQNGRI